MNTIRAELRVLSVFLRERVWECGLHLIVNAAPELHACRAALHQLLHSPWPRRTLQFALQPLRPAQAASPKKNVADFSEVIPERGRVCEWNLILELGKCSSVCLSLSYTQTPFNKMLAAREFCRQPGVWVVIRTDFLLCIRVRLQLPAFSVLHLAVTELQQVSQPFYFTLWGVRAPLAAVPSTLSNHLMCHSSQWNRFHAPVAVTPAGNGSITRLRHSAF